MPWPSTSAGTGGRRRPSRSRPTGCSSHVTDNLGVVEALGGPDRGDRRRPRLGVAHRRQLGPAAAGRLHRGGHAQRPLQPAGAAGGRPRPSPSAWAATRSSTSTTSRSRAGPRRRPRSTCDPGWSGFYVAASGDGTSARRRRDHRHRRARQDAAGPVRRPRDAARSGSREADLEFYVAEFERTGFRGALNRYRNVDRDWRGPPAVEPAAPITVPSLFIGGEQRRPDHLGASGPSPASPRPCPACVAATSSPGAVTGSSRSAPSEVNELLVEWLKGL